jgi:carbamoyl-phosphate synthase (ammonia)
VGAVPRGAQGEFDAPAARRAVLSLEDGTELSGHSFGAEQDVTGEVVFTTGMVGYPEALTDPSFRGQILVLTFPLVGNYGVPDRTARDELGLPRFFESERIWVQGLVCQDYSQQYSHWNAASSLSTWLKEGGVPAIHGIDTRLLTKKIRDKGAMLGKIIFDGASVVAKGPFADPNKRNLVSEVSPREVRIFGAAKVPPAKALVPQAHVVPAAPAGAGASNGVPAGRKMRILAVDCGMKHNMIRELVARGAEVKCVPWDHDLESERAWYDGLFISNGPGDPARCAPLIANLKRAISHPDGKDKPIFGICLGNQLLGLAAGAGSYKMPFGNRGQNQPVINLVTKHAFITPQNHGFAIDVSHLPSDWQPLFKNANDGTNEGIMHKTKPFFTAQFHPEHVSIRVAPARSLARPPAQRSRLLTHFLPRTSRSFLAFLADGRPNGHGLPLRHVHRDGAHGQQGARADAQAAGAAAAHGREQGAASGQRRAEHWSGRRV